MTEVAAQSATALILDANELLRIVDPRGGQVADVAIFDACAIDDGFSPGRTIDYNASLRLRRGDELYSNAGNALARVAEDTVGVHDLLLAPCSEAMFARRGEFSHRSCQANLIGALTPFAISPALITATINVFMNVRIAPDGGVAVLPPVSRAGDVWTMRALRKLVVGIAACSSELTNAGACKPILYDVVRLLSV